MPTKADTHFLTSLKLKLSDIANTIRFDFSLINIIRIFCFKYYIK